MENATAATDPSIKAVEVAVTGSIMSTALTASTATAAKANLKAKVKKEMTAAKREVQRRPLQLSETFKGWMADKEMPLSINSLTLQRRQLRLQRA
jgi:hypothetical protein